MTHNDEHMGPDDRIYDLLCRHVFGEADDAERAEVEAALAESASLREQKAELVATVALVQGTLGASAPGGAETLSPERMGELTAAAADASGAGGGRVIQGFFGRPLGKGLVAAVLLACASGVYFAVDAKNRGAFAPETRTDDLAMVEGRLEGADSLDVGDTVQQLEEFELEEQDSAVNASAPEPADSPVAKSLGSAKARGAVPGTVAAPVAGTAGGRSMARPRMASELAVFEDRGTTASAPAAGASSAKLGSREQALGAVMERRKEMGYAGGSAPGDKLSFEPALESASDDFFLGRGELNERKRLGAVVDEISEAGFITIPNERPRDMFFRFYGDNPFVVTDQDGLSTFAADVDTASFSLARRMLREGHLPAREQIRTEEFVNFPKPDLAAPTEGTFAVRGELAPSPFGGSENRWLLRVGVRAKDIAREARPPLALTFVVDTSGSMETDNRLELVKHALRLLVDQLDDRDSIAIVSFNNSAREVLPPTPATASDTIETALFTLQPGGGTNAEKGLRLGYETSSRPLPFVGAVPGLQRRVIFLSDGVANLGETDQDRLAEEVKGHADRGVFLNTIGVGLSNHNDVFLEQLADRGQGVCDYVGNAADARRAIVERFVSGFVTLAKDLKIQVEFDGDAVLRWRQLGYENRAVADRDFRNDAVDAGEIGPGHQVTCYYEVDLASGVSAEDAALAKVRLRWKPVGERSLAAAEEAGGQSAKEQEWALRYGAIVAPSFRAASPGFRLGALNAQFAELLRRSYHARGDSMEGLARGFANLLADEPGKDAAAVAEMFGKAKKLGLTAPPPHRPEDGDAAQRAAYYESLIEMLGGADPESTGEANASKKPRTPAEYEDRIRELIGGDQEKGPH